MLLLTALGGLLLWDALGAASVQNPSVGGEAVDKTQRLQIFYDYSDKQKADMRLLQLHDEIVRRKDLHRIAWGILPLPMPVPVRVNQSWKSVASWLRFIAQKKALLIDWPRIVETCRSAPRDIVLSIECATIDDAERSLAYFQSIGV